MKVSSKFIICLAIIWSSKIFAAPSLEGLFRNGDNPDINVGNTVTTTYRLELLHKGQPDLDNEDVSALTNTIFVRNIYYIDENGKVELFQITSKTSDFRASSQISLRYISRFDDYFKRDQQITRGHYQALLSSLILNRSQEMAYFLSQYGRGFKYNRDIRNKEKIALYDNYKKYLALDKATQAQEESPLRPADQEKRADVQKLLKESFYDSNNEVQLARVDGKFFWHYDLETISGKFGNEDGRFKKMDINVRNEKVSVVADDYISFDGAYQLPRLLNMNIDGQSVVVTFLTTRVTAPKDKGLSQVVSKAQEAFDKATREETKVAPQLLQLVY